MTFLEDSIVLNCYSDDGFEIQALIPMLVEIGKHTLKKCNIHTGEASIFITNDDLPPNTFWDITYLGLNSDSLPRYYTEIIYIFYRDYLDIL